MNNQKESETRFDEIKKKLENQREILLAEAGLGRDNNKQGEAFPDLGDQATAEAEQNFTLRLREREQKLLKKIESALERISKDSFGICEECEEEIAMPRLLARPVTTFCIDCKTKQEEAEKSRH
ncbi:MAG: TraR/DksA C4-type zinc finger protein [Nitrospirota bacterium]|nr:TraR/DksA C4-type zinc finger protein [Nitrospirota bacterium]